MKESFFSIKQLKTKGFSVNKSTVAEGLTMFNGFIQTQVMSDQYDVGTMLIVKCHSLKDDYLIHEIMEEIVERGDTKIKTLNELGKKLLELHGEKYSLRIITHEGIKEFVASYCFFFLFFSFSFSLSSSVSLPLSLSSCLRFLEALGKKLRSTSASSS